MSRWDELHYDFDNALEFVVDQSGVNIYDITKDGDYEGMNSFIQNYSSHTLEMLILFQAFTNSTLKSFSIITLSRYIMRCGLTS